MLPAYLVSERLAAGWEQGDPLLTVGLNTPGERRRRGRLDQLGNAQEHLIRRELQVPPLPAHLPANLLGHCSLMLGGWQR